MKINFKILLILFVFVGINQVFAQEQKSPKNAKSETDVPVFGDIYRMTDDYFTIWKQTDAEPPVIYNSLLMSESFGVITVGDVQSSNGPIEIFRVNGKFSIMDRVEYKTQSAEIVWGDFKLNPGYLNFISKSTENPSRYIMSLNGDNGHVGIGTIEPSAALEIATDGVANRHALITTDNIKNRLFMVPLLGGWGYNRLSKTGDIGLFWSDNGGVANNQAGFILAPHADSFAGLRMDKDGNVGLGVQDPFAELHVNGQTITSQLLVEGTTATKHFTLYDNSNPPEEGFILQTNNIGDATWSDPSGLSVWQLNPDTPLDIYYTDGNVSIGTDLAYVDYKLAVNGNIISTEVTVKLSNDWIWPDYVFDKKYKLESLSNVENYITQNKHLPGVPTAQEVNEEGINLGEMNAILLQKIEELMLYTIEQQKMIEKQQQQIDELIKTVSN